MTTFARTLPSGPYTVPSSSYTVWLRQTGAASNRKTIVINGAGLNFMRDLRWRNLLPSISLHLFWAGKSANQLHESYRIMEAFPFFRIGVWLGLSAKREKWQLIP